MIEIANIYGAFAFIPKINSLSELAKVLPIHSCSINLTLQSGEQINCQFIKSGDSYSLLPNVEEPIYSFDVPFIGLLHDFIGCVPIELDGFLYLSPQHDLLQYLHIYQLPISTQYYYDRHIKYIHKKGISYTLYNQKKDSHETIDSNSYYTLSNPSICEYVRNYNSESPSENIHFYRRWEYILDYLSISLGVPVKTTIQSILRDEDLDIVYSKPLFENTSIWSNYNSNKRSITLKGDIGIFNVTYSDVCKRLTLVNFDISRLEFKLRSRNSKPSIEYLTLIDCYGYIHDNLSPLFDNLKILDTTKSKNVTFERKFINNHTFDKIDLIKLPNPYVVYGFNHKNIIINK